MTDCLRRAFQVGLRYQGKNDDVAFIPDKSSTEILTELCARFNLVLHDKPGIQIYPGNVPVLVIYDQQDGIVIDPKEVGFNKPIMHAVFASDIRPFAKYPVYAVITGW